MAVIATRREPVRAISGPTKADRHRLRWLGGYVDQARRIVADVREWDLARMELDERIAQLDERLADPVLADHPKRPAAQARREALERDAVDCGLPRPRLCAEFARIAKEVARLVRDLSPAAIPACEALCGPVCRSIDPEGLLWTELGFPAEVPDWCVGARARNVYLWLNRERKKS